MGHFCYPSASLITYVYPTAITEAAHLGTDIDKAAVLPNAMVIEEFEEKYRARLAAREQFVRNGDDHTRSLFSLPGWCRSRDCWICSPA